MSTWDERAQLAAEYLTAQKRMPKATAEYVEPVLVDMARWQREALLADDVIERVASVLEQMDGMDLEDQARAALTAAIEGEDEPGVPVEDWPELGWTEE